MLSSHHFVYNIIEKPVPEAGEWFPAAGKFKRYVKEERGMILHGIKFPQERIAAFCRTNGIRRLALFGSVLRDDFKPGSDVDILVEFHPGVHVGLAFIRLQDELSALLGHQVDLNTPGCLSKYFRDEVLHEAKVLYVAA
jgi:predicted nucleotidyltransferase